MSGVKFAGPGGQHNLQPCGAKQFAEALFAE